MRKGKKVREGQRQSEIMGLGLCCLNNLRSITVRKVFVDEKTRLAQRKGGM